MKSFLCSLFLALAFSVSMAEPPSGSSAQEIALKLYADFDEDLSGCGFNCIGMGQKFHTETPENLRADVLSEIVERAVSIHDFRALGNVFSYFAIFHGQISSWNDRLDKQFLDLAKSPDVKVRLELTRALPGFPVGAVPKFEQILLQDPSAEVREGVRHSQKEIDYEKSLPKAR